MQAFRSPPHVRKIAGMRVASAVLVASVVALSLPVAASADCVHVVTQGETLTSVAATDGLTVGQLAIANGLPATAQLVTGSCLQIPPQSGPGASSGSSLVSASSAAAVPVPGTGGDGDGDSDDLATSATAPASGKSGGSYIVQPGDTLSGIATRAGMSMSELAALNGINPLAPLLSGSVLRLSGSVSLPTGQPATSTASAATSQPVGAAAEGSPVNPPYPTPMNVSPSEVGSIAAAGGVPPALAEAIAYQESGFNNGAVSTADARGVMQILPGTWSWIQNSLNVGGDPLAPASATDNIRGGVLLLHSLLNATGGNSAMAAAGYFQGLPSVEANGVYPSTQQYVNDVMALEQRFGGG